MALHRLVSCLLALLLAAAPHRAAAQWTLSADITASRFSGGSSEESGGPAFRPYRPTIAGLGLEKSGRSIGVGFHAYYSSASLALEGPDAVVAIKSALDLYGAAIEVSGRLATLGTDSYLMFSGGPIVEVWSLAAETSHVRAGFAAAVGLQVPDRESLVGCHAGGSRGERLAVRGGRPRCRLRPAAALAPRAERTFTLSPLMPGYRGPWPRGRPPPPRGGPVRTMGAPGREAGAGKLPAWCASRLSALALARARSSAFFARIAAIRSASGTSSVPRASRRSRNRAASPAEAACRPPARSRGDRPPPPATRT